MHVCRGLIGNKTAKCILENAKKGKKKLNNLPPSIKKPIICLIFKMLNLVGQEECQGSCEVPKEDIPRQILFGHGEEIGRKWIEAFLLENRVKA